MVVSSTSSCSPSPATSSSSRTMSSSSPAFHTGATASCMLPGTSNNVPHITSFAMKGDSVSPGPARVGGDVQPDILSPMDLDEILNQLQDCNAIRYAAYRTASKLDLLRSALRLDFVKLGAVSNIFHQRGFSKMSKSNRGGPSIEVNHALLDRSIAADIITDIFFAAGKVRTYYSPILDVSACTETTLATALLVYNDGQTQPLPVKALKTFFVVLCEARLKDKLSYLFREFADGEGTSVRLTRSGLTDLLETLCQLPQFLGESTSFGGHFVNAAVAQCFSTSEDKDGLLTEAEMMKWLLKEPQVIVWLTTFYRLLSAKGVRHGIRCVNCKVKDITGMRYQCLRCIRYDLCQHCFFFGLTNRGHRLCHPIQEYCFRSTKRDTTKAWIRLIINNLVYVRRSSGRNSRKRYLPHDPQLDRFSSESAASTEPVNRRTKIDNLSMAKDEENREDDDSSGFDSAISSNQDCVGGAQCESPVSRPQGRLANRHNPEAEFNAILRHLEVNNAQMLDKLRTWERMQKVGNDPQDIPDGNNISFNQPLRNCQTIQQQLDKLKDLMESVFTLANENRFGQGNGHADQADAKPVNQISKIRNSVILEMNSLNEPSFMIESTPVVGMGHNTNNNQIAAKNKKLSRLALDNNFSPIVFHVPRTPPPHRQKTELHIPTTTTKRVTIVDVSASVDDYLQSDSPDDDDTNNDKSSVDQTLSNLSLADLTSLLAKTGFHGGQTKLDLNVTDFLTGSLSDAGGSGVDVLEDLEGLLQKLETVFQSFHDPSSHNRKNSTAYNNDAVIIGQIVSEIGDQLDAFAHHYRESVAPLAI